MHFSRVAALVVAIILFLGLAFTAEAVPANVRQTVTTNELIRLRCSHNPDEETYFFFNGTVTAYLGQDTGPSFTAQTSIRGPLFSAVGINVARCYQSADTKQWYLVGREAMWYIDSADNIMTSWLNPFINETVHVVHVDNDPVMQTFQAAGVQSNFPVQVYGQFTTLPSDVTVPLNYFNPLQNPRNPAMDPYSPQTFYQAAELFKFISPTSEVFSDRDSVDSTFVAWTRTSLFLPWMKMGNRPGYLLYSFQGSKIEDYTFLPHKIKAEIDNRLPHYKNAPPARCFPNMPAPHSATGGVSSWSFFKENFENYQNKVAFPLSAARQYGCRTEAAYQPRVDTSCQAAASIVQTSQWTQGQSQTITEYRITVQNTGSKAIKEVNLDIKTGSISNSWNLIKQQGTTSTYKVDLFWGGASIPSGSSVGSDGTYGIQVTGSPTTVAVASVVCV